MVVPYSHARSRMSCPTASSSSVGIGPAPTRVEYALNTPMMPTISRGGTPSTVQAPPMETEDEVT